MSMRERGHLERRGGSLANARRQRGQRGGRHRRTEHIAVSIRLTRGTNMKVNRREMLAGLAASGFGSEDGEQGRTAGADPSLYIPKAHLVGDRDLLHAFMEEHPFVELVTASPNIRITHVPVLLERSAGEYGQIFGHLSRQNPQSQAMDGRQMAVAVFRGPHGYISPTWFAKKDGVPTWNFAVVHASGRPRTITDQNTLRRMLGRLVSSFEKHNGSGYDLSRLPEAHIASLMEGIVGFEIPLESLEGKFKLGQSWSETDKERALEHLRRAAPRGDSLYDISTRFYRRMGRSQPR
jgi:transcriptional regulator